MEDTTAWLCMFAGTCIAVPGGVAIMANISSQWPLWAIACMIAGGVLHYVGIRRQSRD